MQQGMIELRLLRLLDASLSVVEKLRSDISRDGKFGRLQAKYGFCTAEPTHS
jgi:hypothetical protein